MVDTPIIPATQEVQVGSWSEIATRRYLKNKLKAKLVQHLSSKHKALSSIPSNTKEINKKKERNAKQVEGNNRKKPTKLKEINETKTWFCKKTCYYLTSLLPK
jgi:hypothetical protein